MGNLTIRKLDDETKTRLRLSAAAKGISMEEEARQRLRESLADAKPGRTKATIEELLKFSVKPAKPFDQKAASDELSDESIG